MSFTAGVAKNENDLFSRLVQFASGWDRLGQLEIPIDIPSGANGFLRSFKVHPDYFFYKFKLKFLSATEYELYESNDDFVTEDLVGTYNVNEAAIAADGHVSLYYEPLSSYNDGVVSFNAHLADDEVFIKVMEFTPSGLTNPDCAPRLVVDTGRLAPLGTATYDGTDEVYNDKVVLICTSAGPDAEFDFGTGNAAADLIGGDVGRTLTQAVALTEPGNGFVGFRYLLVREALSSDPAAQFKVGDTLTIYFDNKNAENTCSRDYLVVNNIDGVDTPEEVTAATRKFFPYKRFTSDELWSQLAPGGALESAEPGMAEGDPRMMIIEDTSTYRQGGPFYYAIERRRIDAAPTEEFIWVLHGMRGIAEVPADDATDFTADLSVFENAWGRNLSDWDEALHAENPSYAGYHSPCLHIKGTAIRYWFGQDQGSIRIFIQCGDKYLATYLGFYEPYDWPDAYAQSIFVGGSGSAAAPRLGQDSDYHSNFYDPSSDEDGSVNGTGAVPGIDEGWQKKSSAMVWFGQAGFKRMVNRYRRGVGYDSSEFSGDSEVSSYRCAYDAVENIHPAADTARGYTCQNNMYPWFGAMASKLKPSAGSITLIKNRIGALVGELDGFYAFPASGVAGGSEPLLQAGDIGVLSALEFDTDQWLLRKIVIFPNHDYADNPSQWVAMELTTQYRPALLP